VLQKSTKEDAIRHMARSVDRFGPKTPKSPMLIEHHPSHLNKGTIVVFKNVILLRQIYIVKLMLESQRSTKGFKMSTFEFCSIIIVNRSHGIIRKLILQPKKQISIMSKSDRG
jgi:hypothetical protein